MTNQTARTPANARSSQRTAKSSRRGRSTKASRYRRQTARIGLEARRDGQPLIFGWGKHLSRLQKVRVQRRAASGFFAFVVVAALGVLGFGLLQQNVLIPNQSLVTINRVNISQDTFRKYLAYQAQVLWNKLQSEIQQEQVASTKAQGGDTNASKQDTLLIGFIQTDEASYQQSAITQTTSDRLVEDQLIQQGIARFEAQHVPASHFAVTTSAVNAQLASFKKAFPKGETYQQFLSANHLSNDDVLAGIRIDLRRNAMQTYLASLLVSPTKQVHVRRIEVDTLAQANSLRAQLLKNPSDSEWSTLGKKDSLDPTTKAVGGDMGWNFQGNMDGAIENWAFSSTVKVNDIGPVIKDVSSTYNVVQLLGVDPHRTVDASQLSAAKSNALDHWLSGQRADPANHISTPDQTMLTATRNMPTKPDLNATLPTFNPSVPSQG